MPTLKLGMRQGLQGETRAQREGDLKENFNICSDNILTHLSFGEALVGQISGIDH